MKENRFEAQQVKKEIQGLYLSASDADLLAAIDKMGFDQGETEIWARERGNWKPSLMRQFIERKPCCLTWRQ
jgi:hypothetical protein